jgi:diadenosine tetraphosphate (Ap4A) HIT family hydrolase
MSTESCPHCKRVEQAKHGKLNTLIYQNDFVTVIAGDHQFFPGYVVIISNIHIREMHKLPDELSVAMFKEIMKVGRKIDENLKPLKMNYASLGNVDEHLHWHVFPRYKSDPDHKDHPWKNAALFSDFLTNEQNIAQLRGLFAS